MIIYGTGFAATEFLAPMDIHRRRRRRSLQERWKDGARAYLGLCVPDFPNLFVVYGPNTNLGGSSIIGMLEAASGADRLAAAAHRARRRPARSSYDADAEERYDQEIQRPARRQRVGQLRQLVPPERRPDLDQLARPGAGVQGPLRRPRPRGLRDRLRPAPQLTQGETSRSLGSIGPRFLTTLNIAAL